jgi:hypothetical protein
MLSFAGEGGFERIPIVKEWQIANSLIDTFFPHYRQWEIGSVLTQIGFVDGIRGWRMVRSRLGPPNSLRSF